MLSSVEGAVMAGRARFALFGAWRTNSENAASEQMWHRTHFHTVRTLKRLASTEHEAQGRSNHGNVTEVQCFSNNSNVFVF